MRACSILGRASGEVFVSTLASIPTKFGSAELAGGLLAERQEVFMSGINGDKSRFNRIRRQKLARRIRNREMYKSAALQGKPALSSSEKKPVRG
jgi:hypothetical protein